MDLPDPQRLRADQRPVRPQTPNRYKTVWKRTLTPLFSLVLWSGLAAAASAQVVDVWIGTTTPRNGESRGIYHTTLNTKSGKLGSVRLAAELESPGFLALHPSEPRLYAVGSADGEGVVATYAIKQAAAGPQLQELSKTKIPSGRAAHIATDREGRVVLTAQYGAGSTSLFRLNENFAAADHLQTVQHEGGSGVVANRQDKPHAHWVGVSPDNRFAFVPDLGMDKVVIYKLNLGEKPSLEAHGFGQVPPGGGPRHMKFHPHGKHIYVLNELTLSVTVFQYDAENGRMSPVQTIATVPEDQKAQERFVSASEIRVHPTGKFVYAANRGHDTITAFRVKENGTLALIEREPVRGSWPRNFNIDPSGKWLLAAGRDSHTLAVFAIDGESGELQYARDMAHVPTPICVEFGR